MEHKKRTKLPLSPIAQFNRQIFAKINCSSANFLFFQSSPEFMDHHKTPSSPPPPQVRKPCSSLSPLSLYFFYFIPQQPNKYSDRDSPLSYEFGICWPIYQIIGQQNLACLVHTKICE
ncbi:hypothetical protein ACH5RR_032907 [Cinchona calisaya]|uniref:Uncharacterized protein n=1 Tax=Cinchona calisaya TaxID=153742 RepID=A0ABD2YN13_9GENT